MIDFALFFSAGGFSAIALLESSRPKPGGLVAGAVHPSTDPGFFGLIVGTERLTLRFR